ncbi:MAG TPA: TMEM175 family protein [Sphingomonas sp.]|nr:TMEM175 family protein [Sphingomonas sp.]
MRTARLEAFTDGVVAIIITIMVLDLKVPESADPHALLAAAPLFLAYVLAYVNVGLYWANHHHLLHVTERVDGRVLWANLFLLFWLSLVPFVIRWVDEAGLAPAPVAAYGLVLGMAAVAYRLLVMAIVAVNGQDSEVARAIGRDRKGLGSLASYIVAMPLAFVAPWIAILIYVGVALVWLIPDRRIERRVEGQSSSSS